MGIWEYNRIYELRRSLTPKVTSLGIRPTGQQHDDLSLVYFSTIVAFVEEESAINFIDHWGQVLGKQCLWGGQIYLKDLPTPFVTFQ